MNFKDLQFSLGKLSSDVKSHMAKKNPLYKNDTKVLSVWIFQERNDLATMRTLAYRRGETNKSFREWTTNGHEQWNEDDEYTDLQDIGDKLATLLSKANEIEQQYTVRYQQYRHAIKSIREREDALCDRREKRQSLSARLIHLEKTNPKSPKRQEIEAELRTLDNDTQMAEMELGDFKRFALKEAFYIRFNALSEYADKMKLIAGFGKYIVDLLDVEPTTTTMPGTGDATDQQHETMTNDNIPLPTRKPYTSESQASLILNDCFLALDQWEPSEEDERPTLANQAIHDASNDEDANLLTEEDIRYYREQGLASLTSQLYKNKKDTSTGNGPQQQQQQQQQQQCQLPIYNNNDADDQRWNDEKCASWSQPGQQHQTKRDEAEFEQHRNTMTNSDVSPPAYTTAVQSPIPTIVQQDHIRNNDTTVSQSPSSMTVQQDHNKHTTSADDTTITDKLTTLSGEADKSSPIPPTIHSHNSHPMDYYKVYRNKQLIQPSHPSRPYTSFQQQFVTTKNSKCANT